MKSMTVIVVIISTILMTIMMIMIMILIMVMVVYEQNLFCTLFLRKEISALIKDTKQKHAARSKDIHDLLGMDVLY